MITVSSTVIVSHCSAYVSQYFTSVIQQWKQSLKAGSALEKPEGMCMAFFHFFKNVLILF